MLGGQEALKEVEKQKAKNEAPNAQRPVEKRKKGEPEVMIDKMLAWGMSNVVIEEKGKVYKLPGLKYAGEK